jgi:hypothetical protein
VYTSSEKNGKRVLPEKVEGDLLDVCFRRRKEIKNKELKGMYMKKSRHGRKRRIERKVTTGGRALES